MKLLDTSLSPIKLPGGAIGKDYFPQVRKLEKAHATLLRSVEQETSEKNVSEELKKAIDYLLRLGVLLNGSRDGVANRIGAVHHDIALVRVEGWVATRREIIAGYDL